MAESPVVIVTGAGSGVGRATGEQLAESGARVTLMGRTASALHKTATLMVARNPGAPAPLVLAADVGDRRRCHHAVDATLKKWGRIDALVNNAGIVVTSPIDVVDQESLISVFATNVFGPAYLISACWPHFARQGIGRIVNVSSMSTIDPFPGLSIYAASKSALESYTRSIMNEGRAHNILGFSIVLGAVETHMLRQVVSSSVLPGSQTLDPSDAAKLIAACAVGQRDADAGEPLIIRKS